MDLFKLPENKRCSECGEKCEAKLVNEDLGPYYSQWCSDCCEAEIEDADNEPLTIKEAKKIGENLSKF